MEHAASASRPSFQYRATPRGKLPRFLALLTTPGKESGRRNSASFPQGLSAPRRRTGKLDGNVDMSMSQGEFRARLDDLAPTGPHGLCWQR